MSKILTPMGFYGNEDDKKLYTLDIWWTTAFAQHLALICLTVSEKRFIRVRNARATPLAPLTTVHAVKQSSKEED